MRAAPAPGPRTDVGKPVTLLLLAGLLAVFPAAPSAGPQPPDPLDAARRLLDQDRLAEAVTHLEQARRDAPEDPDPLWMLAVARLRLGDFEEAARLAGAFAGLAPDHPGGPLLLAAAASALGRLDEAEAALREALVRAPGHPEARRELASLLARTGRREEAIRWLESLEADYPGRVEVLVPLGVLHVQAGRGAAGLAMLQRAVQTDPGSFEARHHLGALYSELGQFGLAGQNLEAALSIRPEDPGTLLELCLFASREERLEDAREACARAAAADPDNAEARFKNGDVLHYLQQNDSAENAYREALRLDPGHARARLRLGLLLHESGRSAEAIPVLIPAVEGETAAADPQQRAGGLSTLGQALTAVSALEEAERRLREATAASPTTPEPWLHLGNLLVRSGDPEKVEEGRGHLARFAELRRFSDRTNELKAAINANPGRTGPKRALVAHLISGGAPALALEESRRLLTLASAEPVHHLLYAESLAALGRPEEARTALQEALGEWPDHPGLVEAAARLAPGP